ncbi:MAG: DUF1475 family protein [Candidatus Izemoplasmataceae bacterium]
MKIAKVVSIFGVLAMTVVLIYGFTVGNFASDGSEILSNPWGIVSLVDLYVGFGLFSLWIIYREEKIYKMVIWVVLMMVLGFFTGSLYVLIALIQSSGDMDQFFYGKKRIKNEN